MSDIKEPVTRDTLLKTVNTFPIVDNHAHNLLNSSASLSCPLEVCFSEARGEALQKSIETSALKRGVRQLAKLYNCEATLEGVKCVTDTLSYEESCRTCFDPTGIQCLLLDDGLDSLDGLRDVESHVGLVECAKRIVRIERIAEQIISDLVISFKNSGNDNLELQSFQDPFKNQLETLAKSDLVVSFKSIAAYRTGLNVSCDIDYNIVVRSLAKFILEYGDGEKTKVVETRLLVDKILIDYILNLAIEVAVKYDIPIQLHTGFGDNDLDLLSSNPLHLRKLIEKYPTAKFVLLHSSYPYTRQAGYLASVYSNVYVDIGLVFPMISATGQETNLFELLEICPSNKILFSTDGHYLPESFYVAAIQVREALGKVLLKAVGNEDFTIEEAVKIAKQIMFENSNELYKLNLTPKIISNQEYIGSSARISNLALKKLKHMGVKYIRLGWLDFTNILRFRAIPIDRFIQRTITSGITIAKCLNTFPLYGDVLVKETGFGAAGELFLKPDLNTIVHLPYLPAHAFVHTSLENKVTPDDVAYPSTSESSSYSPYQPNAVDNSLYCAAAAYRDDNAIQTIEQILDALQDQNIELEQFHPESAPGQFEIITGPDNPLTAADKVVITRQTIYDVAAKNFLKATFLPKPFRNQAGTASHFHISIQEIDPSKKIYDDHHSKLSRKESFFVAGILSHLKAIAALTLPTISSYERTALGCWTGKWISWGIENRETPIRACYLPREGMKGEMDVNFEIKCVDATANPYLALIAILCAGIDGIRKELELKMHYCNDDPENLSSETRARLGITEKLPDSLADSLAELKKDTDLTRSIGKDIIQGYIAVKENELKFFKNLSHDKIYEMLLERF
ncbi:14333_t:CDS:10 [Funneliformis geosporum]|uniref:Glutamine synthetase n=1 Tax=Funneliformis geosporum TaxID=1117311 RepID=A0A9W4SRP4_9GLOM|nr:14333_t:CDS:10 [Funneliformis geosporum]CAI2178120.1 11196_t:CDS:10 [Funneliformis geosporum]